MTAAYFLFSLLFFNPSGSSSTVTGMVDRSKKSRLLLCTVDRDALRSLQSGRALIYSLGPSFVARGGWWGPFRGGSWENGFAQRFFSDPSAPLLCHLFPSTMGKRDHETRREEHVRSLPVSAHNARNVSVSSPRYSPPRGPSCPLKISKGANCPGAER